MTNFAIIVAAGKGKRMNSKLHKLLLTLNNNYIINYTLEKFENSPLIDEIVLVSNENFNVKNIKKLKKIVKGGEKRQDSVYNGLKAIENAKDDDIVVIHNGANPLVDEKTIKETIESAKQYGAAAAAFRAKDTIKESDKENFVKKTLNRENLWQMQTPQCIKYDLAIKSFENAKKDSFYSTDDVALVERNGAEVKIIETNEENIKLTTPSDLEKLNLLKNSSRIGLGLDSHKFTNIPKPLILGGVLIPNEQGLEANSDGDVILHSLFNAFSQAIGERSIGYYDDSMLKKGITDSKEYLRLILKMVEERDFKINNIGIMIEAKKPFLEPFAEKMKAELSKLLKIQKTQIGITFTSGEELTEFGKGKGIQVFSIVSLKK